MLGTHTGERIVFNTWWWENWIFTYRRMKPDSPTSPNTKRNSEQITDLNVRPETLKLVVEENLVEIFQDTGTGKNFFDQNPKSIENKSKIRQMKFHEIKELLHSKGNNQQSRDKLQNKRKYLQVVYWTKD